MGAMGVSDGLQQTQQVHYGPERMNNKTKRLDVKQKLTSWLSCWGILGAFACK